MRHGSTGRPKLLQGESVLTVQPLPLDANGVSEDQLQNFLHTHPDLLPIEEISPAWGPLIPLTRELGTAVGPADNVYVSPVGELTVVEAKLWRNPEARRKVVGQILDYAAALAAMTYEDLDDAVRASGDGRSIWEIVQASGHPPASHSEGGFVDTVSRNLREGRFLLLVVGDGIRSDLYGIADLLSRNPTLGFHLELVEMRIHAMPNSSDLLVVPHLIGRTEEVTRAVVQIRNPDHARVSVDMTVAEEASEGRARLRDLGEFADRASEAAGAERAAGYVELVNWWLGEGGTVRFGKESVNLWCPRPGTSGVPVLSIYTSGEAQGAIGAILNRGLADEDVVRSRFAAAGFSGESEWPLLPLDPRDVERRRAMTELLLWVREISSAPTGDHDR